MQRFLGEVGSVTPSFRALGGDPLLAFDEWRCLVECLHGTGQIHLSWNAQPVQNLLLIQGSSGMMRVDLLNRFVSLRRERSLPKAVLRVVNNATDSVRPLIDTFKSIVSYLFGRHKPFQGIHNFVKDFYRRLEEGEPPTVTVEDAIPVVHFTEVVARQAEQSYESWNDRHPLSATCDVLVTGGTGRLGSAIVDSLLSEGKQVRVIARREPNKTLPQGLEFVIGDLGDPRAVDRAVMGATTVVHAGAAMSGDWAAYQCATIEGTRNVLAAARAQGVRRLVHISSLSVVDWAGSAGGPPVEEVRADEPRPEARGHYTRSKLEAERLVRAAAEAGEPHVVILRPGQICGAGFPLLTGATCRRLGPVNLVLGDGSLRLPLVHIDDVVEAVRQALDADIEGGAVIQLVDPDRFTQNDILEVCGPEGATIRLPRMLVFGLGWMSEKALGLVGRQSPFSVYRLKSALARVEFESDAAYRLLGWRPSVGVKEGLARCRGSTSTSNRD
jgi:nucleoside-diphosphate-sugar epimerase